MAILAFISGILFLVGWIWAIVSGFQKGGTLWGILNILVCVQPLVGIVGAILKKTDWLPVLLMIITTILSVATFDYAAFQQQLQDAMQQAQ
jgi:cobalamin biosynthesis protein CobD/CbiB